MNWRSVPLLETQRVANRYLLTLWLHPHKKTAAFSLSLFTPFSSFFLYPFPFVVTFPSFLRFFTPLLPFHSFIVQLTLPSVNHSTLPLQQTYIHTHLQPTPQTMTRVNLDGLQSFYALNNARQIPLLGLGVFKIEPGKATEDAVLWALQVQTFTSPTRCSLLSAAVAVCSQLHNNDAPSLRKTTMSRACAFVSNPLRFTPADYLSAVKNKNWHWNDIALFLLLVMIPVQ